MRVQRWLGLDVLRCLAVVLMVQGHTFNVLLTPAAHRTGWHRLHDFIHGLTAPMFLFAAGLAFGVTTFATWEDHTRSSRTFWRRVRRYAFVAILGYSLQIPREPLTTLLTDPSRFEAYFFRVGPLQLIGFVLGSLELLAPILKRRNVFTAVVAVTFALIAVSTPLVWESHSARSLPQLFGAFLDERSGSLFPAFPWASFILAGVVAAHFVSGRYETMPARVLLWFIASGVAVGTLAYVLFRAEFNPYGDHDFWRSSPLHVAFRIGMVSILLGALSGAIELVRRSGHSEPNRLERAPLFRWAAMLSRQSLVAYAVHLVVLYGSPLTPSLRSRFGSKLELPSALAAFCLVFAITVVMAALWDRLRKRSRPEHTPTTDHAGRMPEARQTPDYEFMIPNPNL